MEKRSKTETMAARKCNGKRGDDAEASCNYCGVTLDFLMGNRGTTTYGCPFPVRKEGWYTHAA